MTDESWHQKERRLETLATAPMSQEQFLSEVDALYKTLGELSQLAEKIGQNPNATDEMKTRTHALAMAIWSAGDTMTLQLRAPLMNDGGGGLVKEA